MTGPRSATGTRWSAERIARLGVLVGRGLDVDVIAADPVIATNGNNVRRQLNRFGLSLREVVPWRPSRDAKCRLDAAASRRGITRETLCQRLLATIADDPTLIDAILDDRG